MTLATALSLASLMARQVELRLLMPGIRQWKGVPVLRLSWSPCLAVWSLDFCSFSAASTNFVASFFSFFRRRQRPLQPVTQKWQCVGILVSFVVEGV